jgi:hypothetical protein
MRNPTWTLDFVMHFTSDVNYDVNFYFHIGVRVACELNWNKIDFFSLWCENTLSSHRISHSKISRWSSPISLYTVQPANCDGKSWFRMWNIWLMWTQLSSSVVSLQGFSSMMWNLFSSPHLISHRVSHNRWNPRKHLFECDFTSFSHVNSC